MMRSRLYALAAVILAAAAARLLPHPPNFTPIAAIALFGGAHFSNRLAAFGVPLVAMLLSDLVIGFHAGMPSVYAAFVLITLIGLGLRSRLQPLWIGAAALSASALFFVVTNLGVWLGGGMYPMTGAGLTATFVAAIPFFGNTLAGDMFFAGILFGGFTLAERWFPILREELATPHPNTAG